MEALGVVLVDEVRKMLGDILADLKAKEWTPSTFSVFIKFSIITLIVGIATPILRADESALEEAMPILLNGVYGPTI